MPVIPVTIDNSILVMTSVASAGVSYFFATIVGGIKSEIALIIGLVVGILLYSTGIIPLGLLILVGIGMVVAIFNQLNSASQSDLVTKEVIRREKLGYRINHDQLETNEHKPTVNIVRGDTDNVFPAKQEKILSGLPAMHTEKEEIAELFRKAEKDDVNAQFCLGMMYLGNNIPKDRIEACKWFHIAEAGGNPSALENRRYLERYLSNAEIEEAKRRASSWLISSIKSSGVQIVEDEIATSDEENMDFHGSITYGIFNISGEGNLSPINYGVVAVKLSISASENVLNEIIAEQMTKAQQAIAANHGTAQLHLLVLQASVYYVCANLLSNGNRDVLTSVYEGITKGLDVLLDGINVKNLMEIFEDYGRALTEEIKNPPEENYFQMGATASLVAGNIFGQCKVDTHSLDFQIEKRRVEAIVALHGIGFLLSILNEPLITYRE